MLTGNAEAIEGPLQTISLGDEVTGAPDFEDVAKAARRVFELLRGRNPVKDDTGQGEAPPDVPITWQDLARFKVHICDPVFTDPWWREERARLQAEGGRPQGEALWQLHLFDFERRTSESVICFFLELLLSHAAFDVVFTSPDEKTENGDEASELGCPPAGSPETADLGSELLRLSVPDRPLDKMSETERENAVKARETLTTKICEALELMSALLSPHQRREVAIGPSVWRPQEENGSRYWLISRQWLSTVPDLEREGQLRDAITLRPLPLDENDPVFSGGEGRTFEMITKHSRRPDTQARHETDLATIREAAKHCGPTISGTWYLGALSGGNMELAADVMRALVSEYQELERFLQGSAAPVSKRFYEQERVKKGHAEKGESCEPMPYTQLMKAVHIDSMNPNCNYVFPFCRTRMRNYTQVSLVLYDMIRHAMEIKGARVPRMGADETPFQQAVRPRVRRALTSIGDIYRRSADAKERFGR